MIISLSGKKQSGKDTIADIIKALIYCKIDGSVLTEENFESIRGCYIHNYKVKKFAGKLKEIAAVMLGCKKEDFESEEFKNSVLGEEWWYYQHSFINEIQEKETHIIAPYLEELRSESEADMFFLAKSPELVKMTPRLFLQRLATDAVRVNLHPCSWINSTLSDYNPKETWVITDTRFENEINAIRLKEPKFLNIRVERYQTIEEWCNQYKDYMTFMKQPINYPKELQFSSNEFRDFYLSGSFDDSIEPNEKTHNVWVENIYHESETQLDYYTNFDFEDFDFLIENKGSIGDLINRVREILVLKKVI